MAKSKQDGQPPWPGRWCDAAAAMLRVDLKLAKIDYRTADGFFDFHATRHTGITRGAETMSVFELKDFARHKRSKRQ